MKYVKFICAFFSICYISFSGTGEVEMRMTLKNEFNKSYTVICGVDSTATSEIDKSLGEFAFPNFVLNTFHAGYIVEDFGERVYSYKDIRPKSGDKHYMIEYKLGIPPPSDSRGKLVVFTWSYPLHHNIDSIIVIDEFDGLFVKFKLGVSEKDSLTGNNASLERFNVRVYYNKDIVNVVEYALDSDLTFYPNPTQNLVKFSKEVDEYSLFTQLGEKVKSGKGSNFVSMEGLAPAIYHLQYTIDGKVLSKMLVKI